MIAKAGSTVEITKGNPSLDDGRIGELIGKVKMRIADGRKRKILTRYIVQFRNPLDWSYFGRKEFKVLRGDEG